MKNKIDIEIYETENGKPPYLQWESRLSKTIRSIVTTRLDRITIGNFGDCKSIQGAKGMYELRIHISPGYRIYFGKDGDKIILNFLSGFVWVFCKIIILKSITPSITISTVLFI